MIDPTPPATQGVVDKIVAKRDAEETRGIFFRSLLGIAIAHLAMALLDGGLGAYARSWAAIFRFFVGAPWALPIPIGLLLFLQAAIQRWRDPDIGEVTLPKYDPVPDLRWTNDVYIGSGKTRDGKRPGDKFDPNSDVLLEEEHVILKEKGLFGNLHVKGGVGGGKTATFIMPFLQQAIAKFPKPSPPEAFTLTPDGVYESPAIKGETEGGVAKVFTHIKSLFVPPPPLDVERDGDREPGGPIPDGPWLPYAGMTPEEAGAEYKRLLDEHQLRKWGLFVIDPKGDMTEQIQRMAALYGRLDDVFVLRPDGENTYNPLMISPNTLVQSEMVMDGIEAVTGQGIMPYYRQTMSEWLSFALTLLRAVTDHARVTFSTILRMSRVETFRMATVTEAKAVMTQAMEDEARARRLGKPYEGVRVNPAAIEFFEEWDDEDGDKGRKDAVVSSIKAQSKFFVDDEMLPFLCPEMPPTFAGFEEMIDKGHIVVLQMPLDKYGPVAKVMGILVLADAQQAARARINKPHVNQERVVAYIVDEIANYMNKLTKEFISMNRQSRVCVLAAHQSQGQLVQTSDRGYEVSFNDNLRTKISYSAPNNDSAQKESALFGERQVEKIRHSESISFTNVQTHDEGSFSPNGPHSRGSSSSIEVRQEPWFDSEQFMKLNMGELIVSEFDGITTLSPRKITALKWFETSAFKQAQELELDLAPQLPHPVEFVRDPREHIGTRDQEYLVAALELTGYVILDLLFDASGDMAGIKMITDKGTLMVPCSLLEGADLDERVVSRLTDPALLVMFVNLEYGGFYCIGSRAWGLDRVLGFLETYERLFGSRPDTLAAAVKETTGFTLTQPEAGAWEYCSNIRENSRAIRADSRKIINTFTRMGYALDERGDDVLDAWSADDRSLIERVVEQGGPLGGEDDRATSPDGGAGGGDAEEKLPRSDRNIADDIDDTNDVLDSHHEEHVDASHVLDSGDIDFEEPDFDMPHEHMDPVEADDIIDHHDLEDWLPEASHDAVVVPEAVSVEDDDGPDLELLGGSDTPRSLRRQRITEDADDDQTAIETDPPADRKPGGRRRRTTGGDGERKTGARAIPGRSGKRGAKDTGDGRPETGSDYNDPDVASGAPID